MSATRPDATSPPAAGAPARRGRAPRRPSRWAPVARALLTLGCVVWLGWHALLLDLMASYLHMNDFGRFYYSARAFLDGRDMYGPSPATLAPAWAIGGTRSIELWNLNPPHFHILVLPLAALPPAGALAVWLLASVACLALALRAAAARVALTLGPTGRRATALALLTFAGTAAQVVTGQVAFVMLLPMTLAWVAARDGAWARAGAWLGLLMSVKPFLLVFLPYLVLRRRLAAAGTAAAAAAAAFAVGLAVFGTGPHREWLGVVGTVQWEWGEMNASLLGFLRRTLAASERFAPVWLAPDLVRPLWLAGGAAALALGLAASRAEARPGAVDRDFAVLLLTAVLASPVGWVYYLWLAVGPLAAWAAAAVGDAPRRVRVLAGAGAAALLWPTALAAAFQPRPWATVVPGSLYFLGTAALWAAVVIDARGGRARR